MGAPLYPTTVLTLPEIQGMQNLESSNLFIVPFTLSPGTGLMIATAQLSYTQDYSIRSWVSVLPNGTFVPNKFAFWHLNRTTEQTILIHDRNFAPPPGLNILPIAIRAGPHNLNILNLANTKNIFSFSSNVIELS